MHDVMISKIHWRLYLMSMLIKLHIDSSNLLISLLIPSCCKDQDLENITFCPEMNSQRQENLVGSNSVLTWYQDCYQRRSEPQPLLSLKQPAVLCPVENTESHCLSLSRCLWLSPPVTLFLSFSLHLSCFCIILSVSFSVSLSLSLSTSLSLPLPLP